MFKSKKALNAYLDSDIYKSIIENPDWSSHLIRHYEVHSEASEIQNMIKKGAA